MYYFRSKRLTRREAVRLLGMSAGLGLVASVQEETSMAAPLQRATGDRVTFPQGAIIRTILKDVPPDALGNGATLFHEHLSMFDPTPPAWMPHARNTSTPMGSDIDLMVEEVKATAKDGVSCIVSAGTIDLAMNVEHVKTIAMRSGMHIVVANGYHTQARYPPEVATKTEDQIADEFARAAAAERWGALGEIGSDGKTALHPDERKVLRACCKVHLRMGLPIFTHTSHEGCGPCGLEQLDLIQSLGVDPRHVCIGHLSDIFDDPKAETHKAIAKRGAFVGFDTVGRQRLGPPDSTKIRMFLAMLDAGYEDNLLLSSDLGVTNELKANYGSGWGTVLRVFVPKLRYAGVKQATIDKILVDNSRRFLAFVPKTAL